MPAQTHGADTLTTVCGTGSLKVKDNPIGRNKSLRRRRRPSRPSRLGRRTGRSNYPKLLACFIETLLEPPQPPWLLQADEMRLNGSKIRVCKIPGSKRGS